MKPLTIKQKAKCFDYLCKLEHVHSDNTPDLKGTQFLVEPLSGGTAWGDTYAEAVVVAMKHDRVKL